jgi:tRNA A37 threonylcarbamoyladenosine biosynthesis protein TsaE
MLSSKRFLCRWEIDIDARTATAAARQARAAQVRPGTLATVFDVREQGKKKVTHIDVLRFEAEDNTEELLREAINAWPQFDADEDVNGADLVEWFAEWRQRVLKALK